jgi:hypothetical protein
MYKCTVALPRISHAPAYQDSKSSASAVPGLHYCAIFSKAGTGRCMYQNKDSGAFIFEPVLFKVHGELAPLIPFTFVAAYGLQQ